MKIFNLLILCLVLSVTKTSYAQVYEGGNGDGFAYALSIKNTLGGQSITVLFNGGNGDGFALKESIKNTLGGQSITVLFNGGNGDGFALEESIKNTLGGQSITVLFNGGNGDGFALEESIKNTLGGQSITVLFNGGNGDGFAVTQETLFLIEEVKASIIAFLQGPLLMPATPGLMNDILREDSLIPITSPYGDGATINPSVLSTNGNNAIVDWVFIELRNSVNTGDIKASKSALLQRDGDIVALDGVSELNMSIGPENYYVVVKHRNHLGVMSANPIALSATTTTVDFTDSGFATFGSNGQAVLASGNTAMWAGDVNGNNQVLFSGGSNDTNAIKDFILANPANPLGFLTVARLGYSLEDVDMNGAAIFYGSGNDSNVIKDNVLANPGNPLNFPTVPINGTVPPEN